jgi:hypothetical protein
MSVAQHAGVISLKGFTSSLICHPKPPVDVQSSTTNSRAVIDWIQPTAEKGNATASGIVVCHHMALHGKRITGVWVTPLKMTQDGASNESS